MPDLQRWRRLEPQPPEQHVWAHDSGIEVIRYAGRDTWDVFGPDGSTEIALAKHTLSEGMTIAEAYAHKHHVQSVYAEDEEPPC